MVRIEGAEVTFELDGEIAATRTVVERRDIQDSEGSGPVKADTQVLVLGEEPLVLGSLRISDPVVWYPGGYDSTEVIAVKPEEPEERGPIVQCAAADEQCLELPVGETLVGDPIGDCTSMNGPGAEENALTDVRVTATDVVYTLDVLAPLAPQWGGQWCQPGPDCLWLIDEEA